VSAEHRHHLTGLPALASWRHSGARTGYEVLFCSSTAAGYRLRGTTSAVEAGIGWSVGYRVDLDRRWTTRSAQAATATITGEHRVSLSATGQRWVVDGRVRPDLDGCVDVDFESSAVTNTIPVHRLPFAVGAPVSVPAAFVRADDLRVHRMEQLYSFVGSTPEGLIFDYESATFGFACRLLFDPSGLVLDYPGIAVRDV
jgi:hypothetical protein